MRIGLFSVAGLVAMGIVLAAVWQSTDEDDNRVLAPTATQSGPLQQESAAPGTHKSHAQTTAAHKNRMVELLDQPIKSGLSTYQLAEGSSDGALLRDAALLAEQCTSIIVPYPEIVPIRMGDETHEEHQTRLREEAEIERQLKSPTLSAQMRAAERRINTQCNGLTPEMLAREHIDRLWRRAAEAGDRYAIAQVTFSAIANVFRNRSADRLACDLLAESRQDMSLRDPLRFFLIARALREGTMLKSLTPPPTSRDKNLLSVAVDLEACKLAPAGTCMAQDWWFVVACKGGDCGGDYPPDLVQKADQARMAEIRSAVAKAFSHADCGAFGIKPDA